MIATDPFKFQSKLKFFGSTVHWKKSTLPVMLTGAHTVDQWQGALDCNKPCKYFVKSGCPAVGQKIQECEQVLSPSIANHKSCYKGVVQSQRALYRIKPCKYSQAGSPRSWSAHAWQLQASSFYWAAAIAFSFPRKSDEELLCADSEPLPSYFDPSVKPGIFDCVFAKGLVLFER